MRAMELGVFICFLVKLEARELYPISLGVVALLSLGLQEGIRQGPIRIVDQGLRCSRITIHANIESTIHATQSPQIHNQKLW
jgi:hypothetical protein